MSFRSIFSYPYTGEKSDGIFAEYRKKAYNISIYSPDSWKSEDNKFCSFDHITPNPVTALVDGSSNTAWRNDKSENAWFQIDFYFSSFYLTDYVLEVPCYGISNWQIISLLQIHIH